jgi:hypothetical protein
MARTTNRPSTATRSDTATTPLDTNGSGSFDGPGQRGESGRLGDNAEGRENLTAVRNEQDNDRDNDRYDSRDNRDESRGNRDELRTNRDERGNRNSRDGRELGDNRDERTPRDGDAEQGSRREQRPTPSAGLDAFAPVLEAWKQVFKSWSELTDTMVKVQQDAFASMTGAANATAKNIKDEDRRNGEFAFTGSRSTASRTTASTPDRIEHDRR